ncbi:hypothetical protein L596_012143 [Steinernema carpocapsae]|uniref:Uncharacterized protein n=1 Tax=Steinernema carpocapsae TaxID=34508 RepID=A0A4U5NWT5_STECR|nr:hypothetical protein L596_012143 [Steinernema carpocapsae]
MSDKADTKILSLLSEALNKEDVHVTKLKEIKENGDAIRKRIQLLSSALKRAKDILPAKEGRREVAQKFLEHTTASLEIWSTVKKNARNFEKWTHELDLHFTNIEKLESGGSEVFRPPTHFEEKMVVDHFRRFFAKNSIFEFRLKWARICGNDPLKKKDVDNLCFVVPKRKNCPQEIKALVHSRWAIPEAYEVTKDVTGVLQTEEFGSELLLVPLTKSAHCQAHSLQLLEPEEFLEDPIAIPSPTSARSAWDERELLAVVVVELAMNLTISVDDFLNLEGFTKRVDLETKKLRDLNIDLKMEQSFLEEPIEERMRERRKSIALEKTLNEHVDSWRFTSQEPFSSTKLLTLRDPLELTLLFRPSRNLDLHASTRSLLTCLDLSGLSLLRLDDSIDELRRLRCLSLARNKFVLLRNLKTLKHLHYLDVSHNKITSIEGVPESLEEINFSHNSISHILFLKGLPRLRIINGAHNNIQSIKNLDQAPDVERLLLSSNQIKDKFELDFLQVMPKLVFLDMTANPISKTSTYAKIVTALCPLLKSVDRSATSAQERSFTSTVRKIGRALTIEFIEQQKPDFELHAYLDLSEKNLQMIAIDKEGVGRLNKVRSLNLSQNHLQHLHDLTELNDLDNLNLQANQLVNISSGPSHVLTHLTYLNLSSNGITNSTLSKMGIDYLPTLKRLDLSKNLLVKFDSFNFDLAFLEDLNVSGNQIRMVRKKTLEALKTLNLSNNKLKDLGGFSLPSVEVLDVSRNRITTCAGLKQLAEMPILLNFRCLGNPVQERRVYVDYVKSQAKNLQVLDGVAASELKSALERVKPPAAVAQKTPSGSSFELGGDGIWVCEVANSDYR